MSIHEVHAAEELREVLDQLIRQCAMRACLLGQYISGCGEEAPQTRLNLMGDIDQILRTIERAQKVLASMRKDKAAEESCEGGACETFLAAILGVEKDLGLERDTVDAGAGRERRVEERARSETPPPESRVPRSPRNES